MSSHSCPLRKPRLRAAAAEFAITPKADAVTDVRNGAKATEIAGGLKTTVTMLDDAETRVCLITTHFGPSIPINVSRLFRETIARDLGIPVSRVLIFTSHNHCSVAFASNGVLAYNAYETPAPKAALLPVGEEFLAKLRKHAAGLPERLEAVTVWWAEGREERITYYRKGRREDGTAYLMREEDRRRLGDDHQGDVDSQAPIVVFKNEAGRAIAGLAQFTGHPVTAFHPEKTLVFGEWPQVACDIVAEDLATAGSDAVPVGFLQGCAGDVNSKEMLSGSVERSTEFGEMLGARFVAALKNLQPSRRDGMDAAVETVRVPLDSLPSREVLEAEMAEIDNFMARAEAGDEDTLCCVGQNFPRALSPKYRGWLVSLMRPWNQWALDLHDQGRAGSTPSHQDLEIAVLRVGDVGIVGMPCEPFQNIGRQIRHHSTLSLTIPCGYMNVNHGYITDAENTGDGEYMSAHHRYTKFRAPLKKPSGNVLAVAAVKIFNRFALQSADET